MPVHPNSIEAIRKYQVKPGEVRNPHGRPGRSGLSVSRVREIAKMKCRVTGESLGTEVAKFLFRVVVEGRADVFCHEPIIADIRDRINAARLILERIDPPEKEVARTTRDAAIAALAESARRAREKGAEGSDGGKAVEVIDIGEGGAVDADDDDFAGLR